MAGNLTDVDFCHRTESMLFLRFLVEPTEFYVLKNSCKKEKAKPARKVFLKKVGFMLDDGK